MADERETKPTDDREGLADLSVGTSRRPAGSPPGGPPEGRASREGAAGTPGGEPLEDQQAPRE
ncbi:hypothetical protein [Methylobacterium nigriterrae]|uniref:hypothetical protein n=1 Tax=Methylobacterium nigriterrae TaxID=3127512 RepID=UPI003013316A